MSLDSDRMLALSYVDARRRPALNALWDLDAALGAVLAAGRDPQISRIKLAWWREALEALDRAAPPPEPVLQGIAEHVVDRLPGAELAEMESAWPWLLETALGDEALAAYARARGGALFGLSARLLGGRDEPAVRAGGEAWALADLARRSEKESDRRLALAAVRLRVPDLPRRWPVKLRPLGMLAALAVRDSGAPGELESRGSPGRMLRMLGHRLTGR